MLRRPRLVLAAVLAVAALAGGGIGMLVAQADSDAPTQVEVYLTPACGCCGAWVEYIEDQGFSAVVYEVDQGRLNELKAEAGLDWGLASCHTAFIDGYVVEGHVPAREIRRLLDERPDIAGLSVPGMPVGSPGMEMGDRQDPYDVVAFDEQGETAVFASYHQGE